MVHENDFSKNKTFGNILGHAKGVKDMTSISILD